MRKKWFSMVIIFSFLIIGSILIYFGYYKTDSGSFLTEEELADIDLSASTKAILYFSTTADQDLNNSGLSYAVFIDAVGKARLWKMAGLELGTVFVENDTIFLEEKNKVYIVDEDDVEIIDMPIDEHTGEVTGFNKKEGLFYSVYNSGFTEEGGYHSNVRIGNSKGFKTIHIPYYLYSSGMTDTDILMLTFDDTNFGSTLRKMPLQENVQIEEIASLGSVENRTGMSSILYADDYYYIVMTDTGKLQNDIYRIHEKSKQVDVFPLYNYKSEEEFHVRIPYNVRNSAAIVDGVLYYVDGVGDVYSFDTVIEKTDKAFTLEGASDGSMKMAEQTYFEGNNLHFFRYHKSSKSHSIDTYDLKTGKLIEELPITGLDEMFNYTQKKSKRISSYDFIVLP